MGAATANSSESDKPAQASPRPASAGEELLIRRNAQKLNSNPKAGTIHSSTSINASGGEQAENQSSHRLARQRSILGQLGVTMIGDMYLRDAWTHRSGKDSYLLTRSLLVFSM